MPSGEKHNINMVPDTENAPIRIYANAAVINHSPFDFTINFLEFISPLEHELKDIPTDDTGILYKLTPIVARICMNPDLIPGLIDALKTNYTSYKAEKETESKIREKG